MLTQFLTELASDLELDEAPKQGEGKAFTLQLNPEMGITLKEFESGITLWSQIGPCPAVKREQLFILLMKANFLGQGTGGSVIGLDENENFLTLSLAMPYDMNYKMFKDSLEDFANYLDYWRQQLIYHIRDSL